MPTKKVKFASLIAILAAFPALVQADTCPTKLHYSVAGYWYSNQYPGWSSTKAFAQHITVNPTDFNAAIYSPTKQRIACVYKNSNNEWTPIVSHKHPGLTIDKGALNLAHQKVWQWNQRHKDYACSKPHINAISECRFTIEEK